MESWGTIPVPALFLTGALGGLFCASARDAKDAKDAKTYSWDQ